MPTVETYATAGAAPEADKLRMEAYERCFSQDFQTCLSDLDRAKNLDDGNDGPAAVRHAREYARAHQKAP